MKHFLPIIIIFILIFGLTTTNSIAIDNSANMETFSTIETQASIPRVFMDWWDNITHWKDHFRNFFAKKYKLDIDRKEIVTSYSADANVTADVSTRAISEFTRDELKMDYLKGVLDKKFDDKVVLATCENFKDAVTIKDLAEYKIKATAPTRGSIACYEKIYIESYTVPQGDKDNAKENKTNKNVNTIVRTPIPDEYQSPAPTPDPTTTENYENDTRIHANIFYRNMLPSDSQPDKDGRLPEFFGQWLRPQNEQ